MEKICVFGYLHTIDDKRVFRTVLSLAKRYKVVYIYRSDENNRETEEKLMREYPDIEFIGIPFKRSDYRKPLKRFEYDRKNFRVLKEVIKDVDLVYFHDWIRTIPLRPFKLAKRLKKRVIYDVHEYYPESVLKEAPKFLLNVKLSFLSYLTNKQFPLTDGVIFVSSEQKNLYGIDKIPSSIVIPNLASKSLNILDKAERESAFVIAGRVKRDIQKAIELINLIRFKGFNVKFKIIGISYESDVDYIETIPFQPYDKMMEIMQKSLYGMIIFRSCGYSSHDDMVSLPHKFFDCLASGTPVIVDKYFKTMAEFTSNLEVGLVIDTNDLETAADKVIKSLNDGSYEKYLENIKKHMNKFVWSGYEQVFLDFVEKILNSR